MGFKNLCISSLLLFACTLSGSPAEQNAQTDGKTAPAANDNAIVFGNKILKMDPSGRIVCVAKDGHELFTCGLYFWAVENGKSVWDWHVRNLDRKKTKFSRVGQKYSWEFWYACPGKPSFCAWQRALEILPDGRLAVTVKFNFPEKTKELEFRTTSANLSLPAALWNGQKADLGKKTAVLDDKSDIWDRNRQNWIFAKDDPALQFSVEIPTAKNSTIWLKHNKNNREYTVSFARPTFKGEEITFTMDLR